MFVFLKSDNIGRNNNVGDNQGCYFVVINVGDNRQLEILREELRTQRQGHPSNGSMPYVAGVGAPGVCG